MSRPNDIAHRIVMTEFAKGIVDDPPKGRVVDPFRGADTAQTIAEQGSVLLRTGPSASAERVAGHLHCDDRIARRYQRALGRRFSAGGSSRRRRQPIGGPPDSLPSSPLKAISKKAPKSRGESNDGADPAAAALLAKASQIAIVFVNEPTSEARDMRTLNLTDKQDDLVSAVAAAKPHTIVVLETGGPAAMPWIDKVSAAIEIWYPGIRSAEALAEVLFGDVNPCGKAPATFAKSDADLPHPEVPGPPPAPAAATPAPAGGRGMMAAFDIDYTEGLKIGYKWFDAEGKEPLFPFGFGLSYTTFSYSGLKAGIDSVTFTVRNTGKRARAEIAQVYVGLPAEAKEPPKRLVGWEKIRLAPGEARTVTVKLEPKFLSIFNERKKNNWELLSGEYRFFVGGSSRNTALTASVKR